MSEHDDRIKELNERQQAQYEARVKEASEQIEAFYKTVTQREWLLICRQLDATREQIAEDQGLMLIAKAWVSEKRVRGGASWDRLLDMTDDELLAETGFPPEPTPITEIPAPESVDGPSPESTHAEVPATPEPVVHDA